MHKVTGLAHDVINESTFGERKKSRRGLDPDKFHQFSLTTVDHIHFIFGVPYTPEAAFEAGKFHLTDGKFSMDPTHVSSECYCQLKETVLESME